MTKTSSTTAKLRLRGLTKKKEKKLKEGMKESKKVANEASKRMPSLKFKYIKHPQAKGSPLWSIVQDLRNNGISINSQCCFEAVNKARESYFSEIENKNYNTIPKFKENFIRLHNRDNINRFFKKNGTFYVELKLFPYQKLVLPFFSGDYQDYFLEKIVNKDRDYGTGEIIKYRDYYSLNLTVKKEVEIDYEPKTFIGVDLGLNMIYWAVVLDESENFLDEIHFSGSLAGWVRNRLWKKRKRLQREGALKMVRRIKNREERWMENLNHNASKRIVEFASQFDKPIIILEKINGREIRKRTKNPILHSWTHGKLRDFIKYKALEKGIQTTEENPKNTSRKCPKCGHVDEGNRDGIHFKCLKCGYSNHSDFVGGWNLACS